MESSTYETVHAIFDWYDGARTGIADFGGQPHYYQCELDYGPDEDYLLSPLDSETFQLAMENQAVWLQWKFAFDEDMATLETHPALLEDEHRHKALMDLLTKKLVINPGLKFNAKAHFIYGKSALVKWSLK